MITSRSANDISVQYGICTKAPFNALVDLSSGAKGLNLIYIHTLGMREERESGSLLDNVTSNNILCAGSNPLIVFIFFYDKTSNNIITKFNIYHPTMVIHVLYIDIMQFNLLLS